MKVFIKNAKIIEDIVTKEQYVVSNYLHLSELLNIKNSTLADHIKNRSEKRRYHLLDEVENFQIDIPDYETGIFKVRG